MHKGYPVRNSLRSGESRPDRACGPCAGECRQHYSCRREIRLLLHGKLSLPSRRRLAIEFEDLSGRPFRRKAAASAAGWHIQYLSFFTRRQTACLFALQRRGIRLLGERSGSRRTVAAELFEGYKRLSGVDSWRQEHRHPASRRGSIAPCADFVPAAATPGPRARNCAHNRVPRGG